MIDPVTKIITGRTRINMSTWHLRGICAAFIFWSATKKQGTDITPIKNAPMNIMNTIKGYITKKNRKSTSHPKRIRQMNSEVDQN